MDRTWEYCAGPCLPVLAVSRVSWNAPSPLAVLVYCCASDTDSAFISHHRAYHAEMSKFDSLRNGVFLRVGGDIVCVDLCVCVCVKTEVHSAR